MARACGLRAVDRVSVGAVMNVVEHRAPLKRIDFGLKPRTPEPEECEGVRALRELGARIAQERIWGLVRQSAEGCNQPTVGGA